ncbi:MAG: glycosyltransferase family 1 protein [Rhodothalassiaceae bacterium]
MKIAIITDAWKPQVNGVVRTLGMTAQHLEAMGHDVAMIVPDMFRTLPCPTYPEIRLALRAGARMTALLEAANADAVHIATEGPLGLAARRWCLQNGLAFTTAWHTNFPDYIAMRTGLPERWFHAAMRRFHAPSAGVMAATPSLMRRLEQRGIAHTRLWSRGVDTQAFRPDPERKPGRRPRLLYVGRIAIEKNIKAFLSLDIDAEKRLVGDGPARADLACAWPEAVWTGTLSGEALRAEYAAADVFVFPSRTDTFGLVMLEALACGTPVAAFPTEGPLDVIGADGRGGMQRAPRPVGCLDETLENAVRTALSLSRTDCRNFALGFDWAACARQFLDNLVPVSGKETSKAA